ncbi:MAG: sigma-70 family RNA polymerase sigma factor [Kofleriaceae bacterium]
MAAPSNARARRAEFERDALVHLPAMHAAAFRLTRNPRDAEDLVQDAVLRAYRFWDSYQRDSNCKAWLLRIVTNTFINEYQRRRRSRQILDAASAEQDATGGVLIDADRDGQRDAAAILLDRSVSDDVQHALDALPEDFRTAVVLCDVQGLAYKEIAELMQCPVGTVMSRLFRGRKLLAANLRGFAEREGYVRSAPATTDGASADDASPIDLDRYRQARAKEGS